MKVDPASLDSLSRDELIRRARSIGAQRPEVLTRVELKDEIIRLSEDDETSRRQARGWLGVARDLVAGVVEQRLSLPDAAAFIRKRVTMTAVVLGPPVATVTLAEIYASQGHLTRALKMLDEVLEDEPDHAAALKLRDRLRTRLQETGTPSEPPEEEFEPETLAAPAAPESGLSDARITEVGERAEDVGPAEQVPSSTAEVEKPHAGESVPTDSVAEQARCRPTDVSALATPTDPDTRAIVDDSDPITPAQIAESEPIEAAASAEATRLNEPDQPPAEVTNAAEITAAARVMEATEAAEVTEAAEALEGTEAAAPVHPIVPALVPTIDALMWWTDSAGLHVYWELTAETAAFARTLLEAPLSVKLVEMVPGWEKTERVERELAADGVSGHETLEPIAPGAVVRAALGAQCHGRWVPLALGVELLADAPDLAGAFAWVPLAHGPWQSSAEQFDAARSRALACIERG